MLSDPQELREIASRLNTLASELEGYAQDHADTKLKVIK